MSRIVNAEQNNLNSATGGGEAAAGHAPRIARMWPGPIMMRSAYALPAVGFEDPAANILPMVVAAGTSAGT
jgi:hypothetical protein